MMALVELMNIAQQTGPSGTPDFQRMFMPETPLLEIFLRGTLCYVGIFVMLRVVLKREAGTLGMTDLLVIVMLADAIQNGMADDYKSITDGLLLVTVIIGWSHLLNLIGYKFPKLQKMIHPPPLKLVKDGVMIQRNLKKELITKDELMSQIREQGIASLDQVKEAYVESDGRISVITSPKEASGRKKKDAV